MVALTTMYDGQANSPAAELAVALLVGGTSCTVDDDSILPAAPMKLVIGADTGNAETVLMTNKPGSNVLTITRAQEGTTAREWAAGTKVQRVFTAGDLNVLIDNVEALNTGKQELTNSLTAETALANADVVPFYDDSASAHRKSTWSNIKSVLKTYFDTLYNNYSHPTGDGNSHVPANSTTNNGKVLTASGTAGTYTWESIPADANKVDKATYDAHSVLYATTDNTPVALTVGEGTVVGRAAGGNISALTIDTDLSSVSANDDTVPSAKATKTALDLKEVKLASVNRLSDNVNLADADCSKIYLPHASTTYTLNLIKDTYSTGWWIGIVNDTGGDINVDPAADVTLNGGTATITIDADNEIAFVVCTAANTLEIRGNI